MRRVEERNVEQMQIYSCVHEGHQGQRNDDKTRPNSVDSAQSFQSNPLPN